MGSGAFLVEACRQLGDALVTAWHVHNEAPPLPPDEDELLHARRLVAQRCLYGVDKNEMAVDLAKLSLWLATLAQGPSNSHSLNHALRHGDSLVGSQRPADCGVSLGAQTDADVLWKRTSGSGSRGRQHTGNAFWMPATIRRTPSWQQQYEMADEASGLARMAGDTILAAFFSSETQARENDRLQNEADLKAYLGTRRLEAGVAVRWYSASTA